MSQAKRRMPNLDGLAVRDLSPAEGESLTRIFEAWSRDGADAQAHFNWQYLAVPERHLWIKVAVPRAEEDRARNPYAAVYAIAPRRFVVDGREILGALSLDTLTVEDYQRRGLFIHLAEQCYARAQRDGMRLVYGFPNENSVHGFLKHLAWKALATVSIAVCVHPISLLRGLLSPPSTEHELVAAEGTGKRTAYRLRLAQPCEFDDRFDELWRDIAPRLGVAAVRDRAFLTWRFAKHPELQYLMHTAEALDGTLIAFMVTRTTSRRPDSRAHVMEFLLREQHHHVATELAKKVTAHLAGRGTPRIHALVRSPLPQYAALRAAGFLCVPQRFTRHLIAGYAAFSEETQTLAHRTCDWYISYADVDTL